MKAFFTTILAIACIIVIVFGHAYWKHKTSLPAAENTNASTTIEKASKEAPQPAKSENTNEETNKLLSYTKNWPPESQAAFKQALEDHRPFKILLLGSNDLGKSPDGWAYLTKDKLISTYGKQHMDVGISEYDLTSKSFVQNNKQQEVAGGNWDLILFEPFTYNDNGLVNIDDSLQNITTIIDDVKKKSPQTVFILQPPHPLYNATYYPVQVNALKQYAQSHNISYLDHWTAWPKTSSLEITKDLLPNGSAPNQNGHRIWSDFVLHYFISQ